MPPRVLADRYELGDLLGQGGMGAVYRAHDRTLGREVAVKVLHVDQVPPEGLERFQREAQALASLSHPNIVTIFDFGAADTSAWLVMELLLGPDVSTMVSQQGPLPMNAVLLLGQQLAAALTAAHDAGIVHRDIKPANVMLAGDGHFKLLNLGIARLVGATTATRSALTETGTILGSVPFLAPEVIGGQAAGPPADLYGLGGVLFTVLTGSPPFIGETTAATLAQHLHAPAPRVSATRPDVPAGLDHLVGRLLAKDPQDRPTAAESRTALAALLTGDPGPTVALARDTGATEVLDANQTRTLTGPPESATIDPVALPRRLRERPARLVQLTAAAMGLVVVVLLVAQACGPGQPSASPPTHPPTRTPSVAPSSPHPSTTTPAHPSVSEALQALSAAVDAAAANGGLAQADAHDFQHRVSELGKGAANPDDFAHHVQDFAKHLGDVQQQGHLSVTAYQQIRAALQSLQAAITA